MRCSLFHGCTILAVREVKQGEFGVKTERLVCDPLSVLDGGSQPVGNPDSWFALARQTISASASLNRTQLLSSFTKAALRICALLPCMT
jgi:hypothetical protein